VGQTTGGGEGALLGALAWVGPLGSGPPPPTPPCSIAPWTHVGMAWLLRSYHVGTCSHCWSGPGVGSLGSRSWLVDGPFTGPPTLSQSIVSDLFRGTLRSRVKCRQCRTESVTYEQFFDLSLTIPKWVAVVGRGPFCVRGVCGCMCSASTLDVCPPPPPPLPLPPPPMYTHGAVVFSSSMAPSLPRQAKELWWLGPGLHLQHQLSGCATPTALRRWPNGWGGG
jgi:hypothetical protein